MCGQHNKCNLQYFARVPLYQVLHRRRTERAGHPVLQRDLAARLPGEGSVLAAGRHARGQGQCGRWRGQEQEAGGRGGRRPAGKIDLIVILNEKLSTKS